MTIQSTSAASGSRYNPADYFRRKAELVMDLLECPGIESDDEKIHRLRVSIKKMKALLRLLDHTHHGFRFKKQYAALKSVFVPAAAIRENRLMLAHLQRFRSHRLPLWLLKDIENRAEKGRNDLVEAIRGDVLNGIREAADDACRLLDSTDKEDVLDFLRKEKRKISELMKGKSVPEIHVHEIRKRIKVYRTVAQQFDIGMNVVYTDELLTAGGKWHDSEILLGYLKRQIHSVMIEDGEREELDFIAAKLGQYSARQLSRFRLLVSGFLQREFI